MVKRTGKVIQVPVGEALIGRVVNPLGVPLDGKGPIETTEYRPVEFKAPGVIRRQPVKEPLQTGLKAIDSMIPIGRGQRELIIGDRGTGKTAIAVDTIINQKGQDVICIYVAIGQKASTVRRPGGRAWKSTGPWTTPSWSWRRRPTSAPLRYIAPYAGCAMGEYFTYSGQARPLHLRRPLQARRLLPADVAAAAPARRAARPSRATSSTCTAACWSGPASSATRRAGAR